MTDVVFYFQVHQPFRLRRFSFLDIGAGGEYFDDETNRRILERVAERCYLPTNRVLLEAIEATGGRFRCAFALTGTVLDQLEAWAPEALASFQRLAETGAVEFVSETARHSLSSQGDTEEFVAQVERHRSRLEGLFGELPVTFRNTELIFDNAIARRVEELGFEVLLGEGADRLLGPRSPRRVYVPRGCRRLRLLLRDYVFSDHVAFRFSNREWEHYPLMADTFAGWLHEAGREDAFVGLFMDYETFGEHQGAAETGILEFLRHVPGYVLEDPRYSFATPREVAARYPVADEIHAPDPVSWADAERDLSAWLGNPMQRAAHRALYDLLPDVRRAADRGHPELLETWRKLSTSDHVYYMFTKVHSDGDVHEYFTPYESPHDSFIIYMNVLDDLAGRVRSVLDESHTEAHHPA